MKIFTHKTDAMRQILNMVSRGYSRYTSGEIPSKKAEAMHIKFCTRYRIDMTSQQRWRAKARGEANAFFVAWKDGDIVHWWLLATPGEGLIEDVEILHDVSAKKHRIEITGYELVRTTRPQTQKFQGAERWTWRMTKETYQGWEDRLKAAVRHFSDDGMRQAIYSLRRVPVFSESRKQAFALAKLAKDDWKRIKKDEWPYGDVRLGWFGRFKAGETVSLESLRKKPRSKPVKLKAHEEEPRESQGEGVV